MGTNKISPRQVGNTDLANTAVTSGKVVDNTLTGADIDESSLGKVGDADLLDSRDSSAFLAANAKAADADKLDGLDSTQLKSNTCPAGYVYDGVLCWEITDQANYDLPSASNRCRIQGGRLPSYSEFLAVAQSGLDLNLYLDRTASATGDNTSIYINSPTGTTDLDGENTKQQREPVRAVRPGAAQRPGEPLGS